MTASPDGWAKVVDGYVNDLEYEDSPMKPEPSESARQVDAFTACFNRCVAAVQAGNLTASECSEVKQVLMGAIGGPGAATALLSAEERGLPSLKATLAAIRGEVPSPLQFTDAPPAATRSPVPRGPSPSGSVGASSEYDRRATVGGTPKRGRTPSFTFDNTTSTPAAKTRQSIGGAGDTRTFPAAAADVASPAPPPSGSEGHSGIAMRGRRAVAPSTFTFDDDDDGGDEDDSLNVSMGSMDSTGSGKATPRKWSNEEDELLRQAVEFHDGRNWKAIAEMVPGRNHVQCLQRWKKVLRPGLVKGHWTEREDKLLRRLVSEAPKNWGQVAAQIPGRTAKQCRERWCNHLDPRIKKTGWSAGEDASLLRLYNEVGQRWAAISKALPGRTENAVKIRWKTLARLGGYDPDDDTVSMQSGSRVSGSVGSKMEDEFVDATSFFKSPPLPAAVAAPPPPTTPITLGRRPPTSRRATVATATSTPKPAPSPRAPKVTATLPTPSPLAQSARSKPVAAPAPPVDTNPAPPARTFSSANPVMQSPIIVTPEQKAAMLVAARHQAQQIVASNPTLDVRQLEQQIMAHIEAMHAQMTRFGLPPLPPMPPADMPGMFSAPGGMFPPPPMPQAFFHPAQPQPQPQAYTHGRQFGYDSISPMPPDAHFEFMDPHGMFMGMAGVDDVSKPGTLPIHPRAVSPWGWDKDFDSNPQNPAYAVSSGGPGAMTLQSMMAAMHGAGGKASSHETAELHQFLGGDMGGYVPDLGLEGLEHDALFSGRM